MPQSWRRQWLTACKHLCLFSRSCLRDCESQATEFNTRKQNLTLNGHSIKSVKVKYFGVMENRRGTTYYCIIMLALFLEVRRWYSDRMRWKSPFSTTPQSFDELTPLSMERDTFLSLIVWGLSSFKFSSLSRLILRTIVDNFSRLSLVFLFYQPRGQVCQQVLGTEASYSVTDWFLF